MKVTRSKPVLVRAVVHDAAGEYYYLSNLDQNVAVLMKTVHFFSPSDDWRIRCGDGGDKDVAAVIMSGLERVLAHYYPFQGSLVLGADGRRLAVRNDNRGVPFVDAVADCEMREVGDLSLLPGAAAVRELVFVHQEVDEVSIMDAPLLTVQVTMFVCGGFSLGLAMNHCLADGIAAAGFLRSWAEAARGVPVSIPPFLDRTVQRARPSPMVTFPHDEFVEIADVSGLDDLYDKEPCVYKSFAMDAGKLARLKLDVTNGEASAMARCSTFVALAAFVWRARTKALRMRPEQWSKLLFAVDGRHRVDPPLPPGFFGNAIVFACCTSTAGDLVRAPLSAVARAIRDAIRRTDDAYIRSTIDYMEVTRARPSLTATTLVTAWNRLGFREAADFGWGEAAVSGPAELPQKEVVMFLRDARDSAGTVVLLGLPPSSMQAFQDIVDLL